MAPVTPEQLAQHTDALRRLALTLLRSPDLADDAVQDTLALAWKKRPDVASVVGWLRGTPSTRCVSMPCCCRRKHS